MSTEFPSKNAITRTWHVVDAEGQGLGKLASKAAFILMGKHKPSYTPFLDTGDHVVVINADKVKLTGRKEENKVYRHFTGYPGGLVEMGVRRVKATRRAGLVAAVFFGWVPETSRGKHMYRNLKLYAGDKPPPSAQKPVALGL